MNLPNKNFFFQSMIVARGEVQTVLQKAAIMNAVLRAQKRIALVKIQKGTIVNGMEQKVC